jgi:hypothetical protein
MPPLTAGLSQIFRSRHSPFIAYILVCIILGGLSFQIYGASWDEPNFYDYAAAIPYAYSIQARLSGQFELAKSFGPLPEAHKMYGTAYLLIAGALVKILTAVFHAGWYESWHFINFLSFQLGIIFFYLLCLRWLSSRAALAAALLFSIQPVLWGHAFINPKDIPFMSFFILAVYLGLRGMDQANQAQKNAEKNRSFMFRQFWLSLPAGIAVGFLTSIRILGPFAGILIATYALLKYGRKSFLAILMTGIIALLVNYLTWPYLWENPLQSYREVIGYMSDNPVILAVLFEGQFYRSNDLPAAYFPVTLMISFTEVVFPLFFLGLVSLLWKKAYRKMDWQSLLPVLLWFFLPFFYIITFKPALYDGLRHFIFILPPIFLCAGFALERLLLWLNKTWLKVFMMVVLLFPGIYGITRLYPYEYTYYNAFIGGTRGAFRRFETDYWLTCYKEAMQEFQRVKPEAEKIYVFRNPRLAAEYAQDSFTVADLAPVRDQVPEGSFMLFTTRFDDDLNITPTSPLVLSVERDGAAFCVISEAQR